MKRIAVWFVCVAMTATMLMSGVCATASAARDIISQETRNGDYMALKIDDEVFITEYVGDDKNVVIPSEMWDASVVAIEPYAFSSKAVESVKIPDTVYFIGDWAFNHCTALESVTIPDSVTHIGERAFGYCQSLKKVTIPKGVTEIRPQTFIQCALLKSVTIPKSVETISEEAFSGCLSLKTVYYDGDDADWDDIYIDDHNTSLEKAQRVNPNEKEDAGNTNEANNQGVAGNDDTTWLIVAVGVVGVAVGVLLVLVIILLKKKKS